MRLKDNILFEQNNQKDHSVMGGLFVCFPHHIPTIDRK